MIAVIDVKDCHMKEELDLLCGLPRALNPGVSQKYMIKGGISMNFLAVCRLVFRDRVHFI